MHRTILLVAVLTLLSVSAFSQISLNMIEIPADWGIGSFYWAESDTVSGIPVNVGQAGANQVWDFTLGDTSTETSQNIVSPDSTPFVNSFPTANLVLESEDLSQYGFSGPGYIYFQLTTSGLYLQGLGVEMEGMSIPVVFPNPMTWYELPMDYGDDWVSSFFVQFFYDTLGTTYRIDIDGQFNADVDAWGQITYPMDASPTLRLRNDIDIEITIYMILFGIPIEIYNEVMSYISYFWVCENTNMVVVVMSQEGETNPNFNLASSQGRLNNMPPGYYTVSALPLNPPVQIPAGGGNFTYNASITNNQTTLGTFDLWISAFLPSGQYYGPVLSRPNLTLPTGGSLSRQLSQAVPAVAPPGEYQYVIFIGDIDQNEVQAQGGFTFIKLPGMDYGGDESQWALSGWEDYELSSVTSPSKFQFLTAYPNPFNAETVLAIRLAEGSFVSLAVYDVMGREVANLLNGWLDAGEQRFVFSAGELPSGIYFARLNIDAGEQIQKLMLIK